MRRVIDMQGMQTPSSRGRGVGRYTEMIVREFIAVASTKHEIYLVLNGCFIEEAIKLINDFATIIPRTNIKCWQQYLSPVSGISKNSLGKNISEIVREYFIESLMPDLIWSTNLQEGWHDDAVTSIKRIKSNAIHVTTLHDVIPLIHPETHLASQIKPWYYEKIEYAKQSNIILTVSNYSKNKIVELLGIDQEKVHVAYNAASYEFFYPRTDDANSSHNSYILYVGGGDKHKNLATLIMAYDRMPKEIKYKFKLRFVGVGLSSIVVSEAKKLGVRSENFIFTDYIENEELALIYCGASLFVYPSLSEGFGIPPLEAMACGIPVISSNAASLPEIMGEGYALFDPTNIDGLKNLMVKALTDKIFRESLVTNGLVQADKFSWRVSAEKILNIFENYAPFKNDNESKLKSAYDQLIDDLSDIKDIDKTDLPLLAQTISDNGLTEASEVQKKKLYLDLSCLVHFDHATGIQRVVRAITDQLSKMNSKFFDLEIIFSYAGHGNFYHIKIENGKYSIPNENNLINYAVEFNSNDTLIFLDLHPGSAISKEKTIQRLRTRGVNLFFVIYDLLPIEFPDYFVPELSIEFENWLRIISLSDGALCISRDVRDKYKEWIINNGIHLPKLFKCDYFHLGANISNSRPSKGIPKDSFEFFKTIKTKTVFLMVGTVEPRKGHKFVLDAFEEMWRKGSEHILVIVGKPGWRNEETINSLRSNKENKVKLFWWENASDEFLDLVYKNSTCLIAASEGEGFGLPLIEAAHHKIPIIARDIPVFREVAGEFALYFNGQHSSYLVGAIQSWLNQYKENIHPRSDNMPWLTWEESAKQLLIAANLEIGNE